MTVDAAPVPDRDGRRSGLGVTAAVFSYLSLAFWVLRGLWVSPSGRILTGNQSDQALFLFLIANGERVVYHGASLLHSDRLNVPAGVNMMANTSVLALSIPFAPITHRFGPGVTMALLLTPGLSGSALACFRFLRRRMRLGRLAAWTGGLWGGFAPGWLSHASGHVNLVSGFVLPFILDQVLRLREPGRVWRGGAALGLLIVLQAFISEETLLLTAVAVAVFLTAYAVMDFRTAREYAVRFAAGGAVAAVVGGVLLAFPLYYQFTGPGHYHGQPFVLDRFATSLGSLITLPRESVFGSAAVAARYSTSATEDTVFWGPAACLMILVSVALLWRSVAARAAALSALVLLVMSFGSHLRTGSRPGGVASPLGWTMRVPLLDLVTTPRYALASTAIVGILLAWAAGTRTGNAPRVLFSAGLILALVPLFPRPVPTMDAPPVPAFFSQAMWRPYLRGTGRSVVVVPLPDRDFGRETMRLAALTNSAFPMPAGYFMGPADPPGDTTGSWTSPPRYTSDLLDTVVATGRVPEKPDRSAIAADLRYWNAGVVVLLPGARYHKVLARVLTEALGTPTAVGGVMLWPATVPTGAGARAS